MNKVIGGTDILGVEGSDLKVSERHGTGSGDLHLLVLRLKHLSNVVCPVLLTLTLDREGRREVGKIASSFIGYI